MRKLRFREVKKVSPHCTAICGGGSLPSQICVNQSPRSYPLFYKTVSSNVPDYKDDLRYLFKNAGSWDSSPEEYDLVALNWDSGLYIFISRFLLSDKLGKLC